MNATQLVEDWNRAKLRYLEVQKHEDFSTKLAGMKALQEEWTCIVNQLSEVAETSDSETWVCIAEGYSIGRGTNRDRDQAKQWFQRAAEAGNTKAMVRLGWILRHPDSPNTHGEAVEWYRKAAAAGDAGGMVWLG